MTEPDWAALDAAWKSARAAGVLGPTSTKDLWRHAAGYLPAACLVFDDIRGIDLGTGAGVPGVLLAAMLPMSAWLLIDASERRCAYARQAVAALELSTRVRVVHARGEEITHDPEWRGTADLVVARAFGPAAELAEIGLPLLAPTGRLVVSASTTTAEHWRVGAAYQSMEVDARAADDGGRFVEVRRLGEVPTMWPRPPAARRRAPVF